MSHFNSAMVATPAQLLTPACKGTGGACGYGYFVGNGQRSVLYYVRETGRVYPHLMQYKELCHASQAWYHANV